MVRRTATLSIRKAVMFLTVLGWIAPGVQLCLAACSPDHVLWSLAEPGTANSSPMRMAADMTANPSCCASSRDGARSEHGSSDCASGSCTCSIDAARDGMEGPMAAVAPSNPKPEPPLCLSLHEFQRMEADPERRPVESFRTIREPDSPPPPLFLLNVAFLN